MALTVWIVRSSSVSVCINNEVVTLEAAAADLTGLDVDEVRALTPENSHAHDRDRLARELFAFANTIAIDDVVIAPDKSRNQYVIGRVTGDYAWHDKQHLRAVDWVTTVGWDAVPDEYKTIVHYQRLVSKVENASLIATCDDALDERKTRQELLSLKPTTARRTSTARSPRKAAAAKPAKPAKVTAESQERLCSSCGLKKHKNQFSGDGEYCVDCE